MTSCTSRHRGYVECAPSESRHWLCEPSLGRWLPRSCRRGSGSYELFPFPMLTKRRSVRLLFPQLMDSLNSVYHRTCDDFPMHGLTITDDQFEKILNDSGRRNYHHVCSLYSLHYHNQLSTYHPINCQALQTPGDCAVISGGTVYLVKDTSATSQNVVASWSHCVDLHENSVRSCCCCQLSGTCSKLVSFAV